LLQLLRTAETLWNASRVFFGRWDLSPSQFNLLNLLHDRPEGLSQSDLGRELIMHRSNVTGLVDRLEERGLVARRDSAQDRRAWRVVLTPAGRRLVEAILPDYYAAAETVWGQVPAARAARLVEELSALEANAAALAEEFDRHRA
jgi:DNA-binding MarR family transcriptional regulator